MDSKLMKMSNSIRYASDNNHEWLYTSENDERIESVQTRPDEDQSMCS